MLSKAFKKICLSTCALLTAAACFLPTNKVEARGEAGVAVAAGAIGALAGAAIASSSHHKSHHHYHQSPPPCCAQVQQQTMRYVLTNYNPAFHEAWVQYVVVDCSGTLNSNQQNQLLEVMNQRRHQISAPVAHKTIETHTVYHYPSR